ncbi:hypothetical protein F4823DRAFT_593643 [Ustulina deusta]|nr:hypothetical protein F4823DRAFT_593643 [Ustulina deusta]
MIVLLLPLIRVFSQGASHLTAPGLTLRYLGRQTSSHKQDCRAVVGIAGLAAKYRDAARRGTLDSTNNQQCIWPLLTTRTPNKSRTLCR